MKKDFKFKMSFDHPAVDDAIISAFQLRTGIRLPEDYKKFLLASNGGVPTPQQFDIPKTKHSVLVDYFYGILPKREPCDLEYETNRMAEHLPQGVVLIGHDPGGNGYLLATTGESRGSVYFWDKRGLLVNAESGNTFLLADGISKLLDSLYEPDIE
jgi:hypothetical protein